jgi:hypothetical protein
MEVYEHYGLPPPGYSIPFKMSPLNLSIASNLSPEPTSYS